jgi:hypothetical protein
MAEQLTAELLSGLSKEQLIDLVLAQQADKAALEEENQRLFLEHQVDRMMKGRSPPEWRFRVVSWEERPITFQPRSESQPKTVPGLRLHIRPDDASEGVPYWDITSKRLIATLLPLLPKIAGTNTRLEISKAGEGLSSSYSVTIVPA